MPVRVGNTAITNCKLGNTAVIKIMRGEVQVWPTTPAAGVGWSGALTATGEYSTTADPAIYNTQLGLYIRANGTWAIVYAVTSYASYGSSEYATGTWITPSGVGVGDDYEVRLTVLTSNGSALYDPSTAWVPISELGVSRTLYTNPTNSSLGNDYAVTYTVEIRAKYTATVLMSTAVTLNLIP